MLRELLLSSKHSPALLCPLSPPHTHTHRHTPTIAPAAENGNWSKRFCELRDLASVNVVRLLLSASQGLCCRPRMWTVSLHSWWRAAEPSVKKVKTAEARKSQDWWKWFRKENFSHQKGGSFRKTHTRNANENKQQGKKSCCHFRVRMKEKLNYCRWGEPKLHLTLGRVTIMVNIWQLAWSCYLGLTVVRAGMNISDKKDFWFLTLYRLGLYSPEQNRFQVVLRQAAWMGLQREEDRLPHSLGVTLKAVSHMSFLGMNWKDFTHFVLKIASGRWQFFNICCERQAAVLRLVFWMLFLDLMVFSFLRSHYHLNPSGSVNPQCTSSYYSHSLDWKRRCGWGSRVCSSIFPLPI